MKWWIWIILVIIIFAVLNGLFGGEDKSSEPIAKRPFDPDTSTGPEACKFPGPWSYASINPISVSGKGLNNNNLVSDADVVFDDGEYKMWYTSISEAFSDNQKLGTAYTNSLDGINWNEPIYQDKKNAKLLISPTGWDGLGVETPSVVKNPDGTYNLYYTGDIPPEGGTHIGIGLATSEDGNTWKKFASRAVMEAENSWEMPICEDPSNRNICHGGVGEPSVIYDLNSGIYKMWYAGLGMKDGLNTFRAGYATSKDGMNWNRLPEPVFDIGANGEWDDAWVSHIEVITDPKVGFHMFYHGATRSDYCEFGCTFTRGAIGHAYSADGINWERNPNNPILVPRSGEFDAWYVGGPTALIKDGKINLWYSGVKNKKTFETEIGLAQADCSE